MRLELPKKRHEKLLLIVKKRQELNEERQQIAQIRHNIDQQRCDLEAREAKLLNKPPQEFRRYNLYVDKRNDIRTHLDFAVENIPRNDKYSNTILKFQRNIEKSYSRFPHLKQFFSGNMTTP
jgi:hypothetical protein